MKRILILADLHSGHRAGLTPPKWHGDSQLRKECWQWYTRRVKALQPIHAAFVDGDLIDGRGERSGGTELVEPDRLEQVAMAVQAIKQTRAKFYKLTRGTAYHTGQVEDFENVAAYDLDAEIADHLWPEVNGVVFDLKHHIGGSSVPYGRRTAVERDALWNALWAEAGDQPRADVYIRAHVHYFGYSGNARQLAITCPALQAANTKYGARRCSGTIDFGFLVFDITNQGEYTWHPELLQVQSTVARTSKL